MLTTSNGNSTAASGGGDDGVSEEARTQALYFFLEHLMQKNGRRTLHDLSCQFGARGFTDAMRQAVGGTQEALTDFLGQFPALFQIQGDEISLAMGHGDLSTGGTNGASELGYTRNRDYEREAVQFFERKLTKFGPEVQIKSLLGHRSQAAPEIRLISGRHLKDFAEFLTQHNETFIVDGDRVRLRNMPEPEVTPEQDLDETGQPLSGQRAKQAAVDFLRDTVDTTVDDEEGAEPPPMPLETLYQRFCDRFSHPIRQQVATNPKELLQFLKLNRAIFFIRSNKVSLVREKADTGDGDPSANDGGDSSLSSTANTSGDSDNSSPSGQTAKHQQQSDSSNGQLPSFMTEINLIKGLKQAQTAVSEISASIRQSTLRATLVMDMKVINLGAPLQPPSATPSLQQEFLSVVVLGAPNRKLYVFDVAHSDSIVLESGLKQLLEGTPECVKVIHGCRRGCLILYQRYGIQIRNVFDTQIAHSVSQHEKFDKPLHELKPISFHYLQRIYHPESILQSEQAAIPKAPNPPDKCWSQRPMTNEMLQLVVEEAKHLPVLHKILDKAVSDRMRRLFEDKCAEATTGTINNPVPRMKMKSTSEVNNVPPLHSKIQPALTGPPSKLAIDYPPAAVFSNGIKQVLLDRISLGPVHVSN